MFTREELANLDMAMRGHVESWEQRMKLDYRWNNPALEDDLRHLRQLRDLRNKIVSLLSSSHS